MKSIALLVALMLPAQDAAAPEECCHMTPQEGAAVLEAHQQMKEAIRVLRERVYRLQMNCEARGGNA